MYSLSLVLSRSVAVAVLTVSVYAFWTDQLCLPSKVDGCRAVHGFSSMFVLLAAGAFATLWRFFPFGEPVSTRRRILFMICLALLVPAMLLGALFTSMSYSK